MEQDVLQIATDQADDITILRLSGELDSMNVTDLNTAYNALLESGRSLLVVDLSGLDFIDSAGLGGLVSLWERSMERGCFVAIGAQSPRVKEVLQITGLNSVLKVFESMDAAKSGVRGMMAAFPARD